MYSELLKLFDVREVANLVQDTLGSLPTIMHVDDSLQAIKLQCIGKTVESQLYTNPGRGGSLLEVSRKPSFTACSHHGSALAIQNKNRKVLCQKHYVDGKYSIQKSVAIETLFMNRMKTDD